jgi:hypothetical protein
MKKLSFLLVGMLLSILCIAIVSCQKREETPSNLHRALTPIFLKTTPGEETVLLADSKISERLGVLLEEQNAILSNFESLYGKENVRVAVDLWGGDPMVAYCYELTLTMEFPESAVPSAEQIAYSSGLMVSRLDGCIAICKTYVWAASDQEAERKLKSREARHTKYLIGTSTIKNLGHEVHNMPIEF